MRRAITIVLTILLVLAMFVSCKEPTPQFTVNFDSNGGIGEMTGQTVNENESTELKANTFTKDGYVFARWNTKADGSGTGYADRNSISVSSDITLYAQWAIGLAPGTAELTTGTYLLNQNLSIDARITVTGNVTLLLADGYTLQTAHGIFVGTGNKLTIDAAGTAGTGRLLATNGGDDAAIGGNNGTKAGEIVINGGYIYATQTQTSGYAAAIGGGRDADSGFITINGGTVTASMTSLSDGAAIGGSDSHSGGVITINGGTVTATGGTGSGASGSGIGGGAYAEGGLITINGGTVTATGGEGEAAGIGGGKNYGAGTIIINGGKITAAGAAGADGIGAGNDSLYGTGQLIVGTGVSLKTSDDNSNWSDYSGTRNRYMKTSD